MNQEDHYQISSIRKPKTKKDTIEYKQGIGILCERHSEQHLSNFRKSIFNVQEQLCQVILESKQKISQKFKKKFEKEKKHQSCDAKFHRKTENPSVSKVDIKNQCLKFELSNIEETKEEHDEEYTNESSKGNQTTKITDKTYTLCKGFDYFIAGFIKHKSNAKSTIVRSKSSHLELAKHKLTSKTKSKSKLSKK